MPQPKAHSYDDAAVYEERPSGLVVLLVGMLVGLLSAAVFFTLALASGLIQFAS